MAKKEKMTTIQPEVIAPETEVMAENTVVTEAELEPTTVVEDTVEPKTVEDAVVPEPAEEHEVTEPETVVDGPEYTNPVGETVGVVSPTFPELPEDHPNRYSPIFSEEAYDLSKTKEDDVQTKVIAKQMVHYMKDDLIKLNKSAGGDDMTRNKNARYDKPWYGVYAVDNIRMRGHHIGEIIPEIAYLPNKRFPLRKEMLNLEWIQRLTDAGCIVEDLTPGVWSGWINSRNVASYLKKVHWMLDNGKLRP